MQYELNLKADTRCANCHKVVPKKDAVRKGESDYCSAECRDKDPFKQFVSREAYFNGA